MVQHAGVDARLAARPSAVRLPETDNTQQHLQHQAELVGLLDLDCRSHLPPVEVVGGEAAPAVPVAAVRHQLQVWKLRLHWLAASSAHLAASDSPPGAAGLLLHHLHTAPAPPAPAPAPTCTTALCTTTGCDFCPVRGLTVTPNPLT